MIYGQLNAAGHPEEIPAGRDTAVYRIRIADEFEAAWSGTPVGDYYLLPEPLTLPAQALAHYGPADFDRYAITTLEDPTAPEGQEVAGYTLDVTEAGAIILTPSFRPAPPPPRREIPKLTVQSRLKGIGRLGAAWTALQADPDKFGRWFLDGLNVYSDDADLLALLAGIGCSSDEVAQVTA